eukprot:scaffold789_cov26-Tisochrysis_lutea.AAC.1
MIAPPEGVPLLVGETELLCSAELGSVTSAAHGGDPRTKFIRTSADWARRSSATGRGADPSSTRAGGTFFVRCRLFWNQTCTCLALTLRCEASCCRSSLPGHFSRSKTRSRSRTSWGLRTHRLDASRSSSCAG